MIAYDVQYTDCHFKILYYRLRDGWFIVVDAVCVMGATKYFGHGPLKALIRPCIVSLNIRSISRG